MIHLLQRNPSTQGRGRHPERFTPIAVTLFLSALLIQNPLGAQTQIEAKPLSSAPESLALLASDVMQSSQLLADEYNLYDNTQLDALFVQGRQQQEAGNHAFAVEYFERAWQSSRVANGLYHTSQVPLIESMIVSEIELEDWQAIDDHYSYLELLYTRLFDETQAELEEGLQKVSSWHINAFNLNLDGKREQHLREARKVLKLRLEVANNTLPAGHPRFDFLHQSIRLSEQHLFLMSERYKEQLRRQQRAERDRLLATLD